MITISLAAFAVAAPAVPAPGGVERVMSPTGVAALLIFAFIVDYFAIFPAWIQTRVTFLCAVVGLRQGFDAGPLDTWTVEKATDVVRLALAQAEGSFIAAAIPLYLLGIAVGCLSLYTLGCMAPVKWSKKLGRIVTATFKESGFRKVSYPLWILAAPLALFAELPQGWMGWLTEFTVDDVYVQIAAPIPRIVFGVA